LALRLARRGRVRQPRAVGDALRLRRAPREELCVAGWPGTIHPVPVRPSTPTVPELRGAVYRRVRRLRTGLWGILQTTIAAGAAWGLASLLHPHPYFAPAAAVISLGLSRGGRTVRAIELTVGVAVGIAVADVIVRALGTNTLVLMLVVGLSMVAALLVGVGR